MLVTRSWSDYTWCLPHYEKIVRVVVGGEMGGWGGEEDARGWEEKEGEGDGRRGKGRDRV